jgi:hypothetical protein
VTLLIDLHQPRFQSCDLCGSADARGGVRLQDDTGATRVFCRSCTTKLVEVVLTPASMPVHAEVVI